MRRFAVGALLAAAFSLIAGGVMHYRASLIAQGDAQGAQRVQKRWDKYIDDQNKQTEKANQERSREAQTITAQIAALTDQRDAARAAADHAQRQLREQIAHLNTRPNPYPLTDAGLAACLGDAAIARELFGESAGAYAGLADSAEELRIQVIGLQAFAHDVCRAGNTLAPIGD